MKNATRADLSAHTWRKKGDVWQTKRKVEAYSTYSTFTIRDITEMANASGWEEVTFEVEKEYKYGDEYAYVYMSGWSPATEFELTEAVEKINDERAQQAAWQEKQAEALKKSRPDLFQ